MEKNLTRKEKIRLCSGKDLWHTKDLSQYGLPAMMMCDGPHGLRCQPGKADILGINESLPATCFPTAVTTACSWDETLLGSIGEAIALEAKAAGVGLVLGPGANIKRDPLCGRNFEYFSEDPYLAGKMAAAFIRGAEATGVGTSLKHFALNNQEYKRGNGNSQADERTMREIYLAPFETAVKEGKPATVMSSYNRINGVHASDNYWLLTQVLRQEWGFDGLVVTDWGGMNDRVAAMKAGCDLMMPGGSDYMEKALSKAVAEGSLSEQDIDRCVQRVRNLMERANALQKEPFDQAAHHALARRAAVESAVLLKNEDSILPLQADVKIAVIGHMARQPRYQGAGSSHINPIELSVPADFLPGEYAPGCHADGSTTEILLNQAATAAAEAEVAVVFAGLPDAYESEGFDRDNLKMPEGHVRMIEAVAKVNPNTIVVLSCGSVVECPWADQVKAVLYLGLPGQGGGEAVADLLYGRANPCGKLAESWPFTYEDCVTAPYYKGQKDPQYREGIYVGYRYYDKAGKEVRWPFGYGLSYTTFAYTDLCVDENQVTVTVANTGSLPGGEVVQLYVGMPQDGIHRPVKELKGFCKVFLQPGERTQVRFTLDDRSFALWNDGWATPVGEYTICIGRSSRDMVLTAKLHRTGVASVPQEDTWYSHCQGTPTQADFEKLYGPVMEEDCTRFTLDSTLLELAEHSLVAKGFSKIVKMVICNGHDPDSPECRMMLASSLDAPLRNLQLCGGVPGFVLQGLLWTTNLGKKGK